MKWFSLAVLFAAVEGCTSQTVPINTSGGLATSGGSSATGAASTGTASGGGTSSGGETSSGTTSGGALACDPACGANASCDAGVCYCTKGMSACPAADAGLNCVDENTDNANCAGCDNICPVQSTCHGGVCDCDAGPACSTNDGGLECVEFGTDSSNCGSCGHVCSVEGSTCIGGECVCPSGSLLCGLDAGSAPYCINVQSNPRDCGSCGNSCATILSNSSCRNGICGCNTPYGLCAKVPASSPPVCDCQMGLCTSPSFATDVYPLLAQQAGAFGCAATGCHSGGAPAAGLTFLDESGDMDAGMAYAELIGLDGGNSPGGVPTCDAGLPAGAPSTECACISRVLPSDLNDSYLIDVLTDKLPPGCAADLPMPINSDGGWEPLAACPLQLIEQWVEFGANP